jgi:non-homologous end joining protein Ku
VKPYRSWKGALELVINDVPLAVSVELYARVKKQRNEHFRNLAPSGKPVQQQNIDSATGKSFKDAVRKGIETGPNTFAVMTPEAIEKIDEGVKTAVIPPEQFCPIGSIALDLAIDRFAVRPQDDVAGAADALNIVWNGLRANELAWLAQVSLRGGHDAILVLYADDAGMWAALLPFEEECYPTPTYQFQENEKAAQLFGRMVEQEHEVEEFDHSAWVSEYRARRMATIEAVLAGQEVEVASPPKGKDAVVPDLLAALESSTKKPAKKATKKPAAKKTAKKAA